MTVVLLSSTCWYLSYQSDCYDKLGYDMGWAASPLLKPVWKPVLNYPKSRYLIFLYSKLMDQFEGSRRFNAHQWNSSATRESSHVIISKSCLNSTRHSACTSEVRNIFDRQTFSTQQLMTADVLKCSWDRCNLKMAPICNITNGAQIYYGLSQTALLRFWIQSFTLPYQSTLLFHIYIYIYIYIYDCFIFCKCP